METWRLISAIIAPFLTLGMAVTIVVLYRSWLSLHRDYELLRADAIVLELKCADLRAELAAMRTSNGTAKPRSHWG